MSCFRTELPAPPSSISTGTLSTDFGTPLLCQEAAKWLASEEPASLYVEDGISSEWKALRNQALGERLGLVLLGLDCIRELMDGDEEIFFAHHQTGGIEAGKLEAVAMRNGV